MDFLLLAVLDRVLLLNRLELEAGVEAGEVALANAFSFALSPCSEPSERLLEESLFAIAVSLFFWTSCSDCLQKLQAIVLVNDRLVQVQLELRQQPHGASFTQLVLRTAGWTLLQRLGQAAELCKLHPGELGRISCKRRSLVFVTSCFKDWMTSSLSLRAPSNC